MAESVTNSDVPSVKPPPKRRRILDPSAIVPVPVYSSKVSSSLQLKPMAPVFTETETKGDDADDISSWSQFSSRGATTTTPPPPAVVSISDSDSDEVEQVEKNRAAPDKVDAVRCPSPPPPESPVQKQSRQVKKKISEINRRLRAVNSLLSPDHQDRTGSRSRRLGGGGHDDDDDDDDDDVIIMTPGPGSQTAPYSSSAREIPLKIRCRTDVHKIPVLPSTPLSEVLAQLSVTLEVPPPRLLLLREDEELPTDATVGELGLGIADIIECVVMAAEDKNTGDDGGGGGGGDVITVRLQSKDRDSSQEFSLHRDAPLGSVFSQYLSRMSPRAQTKVRFHFDGSKVSERQTPAELDMEDGDIVEVWT